jgi:hypothetical protein
MDVSELAVVYVHVIEPVLKVLAFFLVVLTLLYLFNAMGDSKKKADMVNGLFNILIKGAMLLATGLGRGVLFLGRLLLRIINLLVATISDFFTSKI